MGPGPVRSDAERAFRTALYGYFAFRHPVPRQSAGKHPTSDSCQVPVPMRMLVPSTTATFPQAEAIDRTGRDIVKNRTWSTPDSRAVLLHDGWVETGTNFVENRIRPLNLTKKKRWRGSPPATRCPGPTSRCPGNPAPAPGIADLGVQIRSRNEPAVNPNPGKGSRWRNLSLTRASGSMLVVTQWPGNLRAVSNSGQEEFRCV